MTPIEIQGVATYQDERATVCIGRIIGSTDALPNRHTGCRYVGMIVPPGCAPDRIFARDAEWPCRYGRSITHTIKLCIAALDKAHKHDD